MKKGNHIFFQSRNHVDFYLKPQYLIKSGYNIVPSPSTALMLLYSLAQDQYHKIFYDQRKPNGMKQTKLRPYLNENKISMIFFSQLCSSESYFPLSFIG